jgi:hypothetical protein
MNHHQQHNGSAEDLARLTAGEGLLRAEIAFWRDMIESCDADHPADSLERMRQALGLAEYRLLELYRGD